jgi:hypothetical protein
VGCRDAIAVGGLRLGLRLVRRNRTLILFLRRFGYDDAQSAVTYAVLQTIGSSWRVVTLDDAEMAPIGVAEGTRVLFRAGQLASKHVLAIAQFLGVRTFPILITAMWAVLALGLMPPAVEFARTGATTPEAWIGAIDPYMRILASVFERRLPFDVVGPTLPGVFALLAIAAAISFATLLATLAALVSCISAEHRALLSFVVSRLGSRGRGLENRRGDLCHRDPAGRARHRASQP